MCGEAEKGIVAEATAPCDYGNNKEITKQLQMNIKMVYNGTVVVDDKIVHGYVYVFDETGSLLKTGEPIKYDDMAFNFAASPYQAELSLCVQCSPEGTRRRYKATMLTVTPWAGTGSWAKKLPWEYHCWKIKVGKQTCGKRGGPPCHSTPGGPSCSI